ncbi:transcriptional regulator, DeoR family [Desulforamulus reducens MI-1]|uniref:Transcriptional regulator, DeoR family n=1 Tax=Desulforamulus reducens (strain ATCC BAA-1160 / DSM 100696 / MI-1) TaxID=349161 RepID=A4J0S8_DESRM|nr:DeoR/GlpR family DNA-binding transcription regulator [Desulforamulus reducens]ABO48681.1 transcriptional regulator, DeoR family [Desulforamulus reducens MI-1]
MGSERQEKIQSLLREHGNLTVAELAQRFDVSEMTIRRDLKALAALGLIQREHGRALFLQTAPDDRFFARLGEAEQEKIAIGRLAADLIAEGETIILDAGTTTLAVAQEINKSCVVITNSLPIASTLANHGDEMTVLITGGEVRGTTQALVGPMARGGFTGFNADKVFLAATGINIERGLSTDNMLESEVKQAMLDAARQVILVAHSKKFGQVYYHTFAHWNRVHTVITDAGLPENTRRELENLGVQVMIAENR